MLKSTLATIALLSCSLAFAEPKTASFEVNTPLEVITGVGLLMNPGKVIQKEGVVVTRKDTGTVHATFPYDTNEISPETLASVMLFTSEGDVAVGTMRRLTSATVSDLPACPPEKSVAATATNQVGLLQSLVGVRAARRDNAEARVRDLMKDDFIATLRKLEKGFGLVHAKELSADLPPLELIDRLTRILNAVKNYRTTKPKSS